LFFVIFSLGFAIGKEVTRKQSGSSDVITSPGNRVVVYYLRSTFRCWQCNLIEQYIDQLINNDFLEDYENDLLDWIVVDYLQNDELANRYNISGNTVIVSLYKNGSEFTHHRLDRVMEKVFHHDVFMDYVSDAIKDLLDY